MTSMSAAFAKAGRKGPRKRLEELSVSALTNADAGTPLPDHEPDADAEDRLERLATMTLESAPQNFEVALGLFLQHLMDDAGALNALMGPTVRSRAADYLHERWNEMHGKPLDRTRVREHDRGRPGAKVGGHSAGEAQKKYAANGGSGDAPAAISSDRVAAAKQAGDIIGASWFDREKVNGKALGDLSYAEMKRSAIASRNNGLRDLRQAYILVRTLKSVAYHEGIDQLPARKWAAEEDIAAAHQRFAEFGHLLTGEIDAFLKIEDKR